MDKLKEQIMVKFHKLDKTKIQDRIRRKGKINTLKKWLYYQNTASDTFGRQLESCLEIIAYKGYTISKDKEEIEIFQFFGFIIDKIDNEYSYISCM